MITKKTAALIAAMSVLSTVAPAAFAQNIATPPAGNTVDADQSNSFSIGVGQSQSVSPPNDDDDSTAAQGLMDPREDDGGDTELSQGFCLQTNQQNAAAGDDATNGAVNSIFADRGGEVDCS